MNPTEHSTLSIPPASATPSAPDDTAEAPTKANKLLCLCDSPTLQTGFARVAKNLITRWHGTGFFEQIWVWGIGYNGFPHGIDFLANRICPGSNPGAPLWYDPLNTRMFVNSLDNDHVGDTEGGFTHVWIMQDTFSLAQMAPWLKQACAKSGAASFLYFPVDAPLDPKWSAIIEAVDVPVAYCQYGIKEAIYALLQPLADEAAYNRFQEEVRALLEDVKVASPVKKSIRLQRDEQAAQMQKQRKYDEERAMATQRLLAIGHGVDATVYKPLVHAEDGASVKYETRKKMFGGLVKPTDFLMINVSQHQKRKGLAQSLLVLRDLKGMAALGGHVDFAPKLYLHMAGENPQEGTNLKEVATQLGLVNGVDVFYADGAFSNGHAKISEENLNYIYNCADLLLTTSYGEGWGLPITEAMAAGVPVAGPRHTSIGEILGDGRGILFDTLGIDVIVHDNSRVRPRSDTNDAARRILDAALCDPAEPGSLARIAIRGMEWARGEALNWDRIAAQWMGLFEGSIRKGSTQRRRGAESRKQAVV